MKLKRYPKPCDPKIEEIFNKVLAFMYMSGFPDAFIGGGAVRELILGKSKWITDIDVFTWFPIPEKNRMFTEVGDESFVTPRVSTVSKKYTVPGVNYKIDLIQLSDLLCGREDRAAAVSQFSTGLSQAIYTDEGEWISEAFIHDSRHKLISVTYCESPREAIRLLCKLHGYCEKYHDYSIVIPPRFISHFAEVGSVAYQAAKREDDAA